MRPHPCTNIITAHLGSPDDQTFTLTHSCRLQSRKPWWRNACESLLKRISNGGPLISFPVQDSSQLHYGWNSGTIFKWTSKRGAITHSWTNLIEIMNVCQTCIRSCSNNKYRKRSRKTSHDHVLNTMQWCQTGWYQVTFWTKRSLTLWVLFMYIGPLILWIFFYVLSRLLWILLMCTRPIFYVNGPIFYYGSFLCTAPPTVHKKDP